MKVWHIRKTEEDRYQIHCDRELDEEANSIRFMGMLNAKHFNHIQIKDFILFLDAQKVGYDTTINFPQSEVAVQAAS
jgi:hypothetical protein